MHRLIFILLFSLTIPILAQPNLPDDLIPIPEIPELPDLPELSEPPPLPPELELDPELEPQITIIQRGEDIIEEHRINGELYMVKVIPRIGLPYYLVKNRSRGINTHQGEPGNNVSAPMWRILEF
ncbi:MAG: DUF2782 domain-containing protein [Nitrosomonas sp.]|nr:DUF2782 domain-containing protein [Nitrosomonas sp.]